VCGDRALRELSTLEGVDCHGVLWVLDQILDAGIRREPELADALKAIASHPRCRLPHALVSERLTRYSKS
jgi:hypothetical protein